MFIIKSFIPLIALSFVLTTPISADRNSNHGGGNNKGDFIIDDSLIFEIGGASKTTKQISGMSNAYLAKDNIEIGDRKTIPLWMFGLLY